MANNCFPLFIPCHRVVAAGSKLGGFSAPGGVDTKRQLLAWEAKELVIESILRDTLSGLINLSLTSS